MCTSFLVHSPLAFFFLMIRRPPRSTLFPYTSSSDLRTVDILYGRTPHPRPLSRGLGGWEMGEGPDRKSTRLNSSHTVISYAVFCLKKKKLRPLRRGHLLSRPYLPSPPPPQVQPRPTQ